MSHRALWLIMSLVCLLSVAGITMAIGAQGENIQLDTVYSAEVVTYTMDLPMVVNELQTITIWNWWDDDLQQELQNIVHDYNLAHPEVFVQLVEIDDMDASMSPAIPRGVGPDIVYAPIDKIGQWVSAGYLAPLDPYLDLSYMNATFEPIAVDAVVYDEQIWGIPESQEGIALVYNRDIITDTEIPAADDFESVLVDANEFRFLHPTQYYLCNQGLGNVDPYHVAPIYFGFGLNNFGGYVDENGTAYMDTPEALNAAQWIKDLRPYSPASTSYWVCREMLVNGEAAIWWTGPWAIPDLEDAGVNYGIAPMGNPFVGVRNFVLTSNAVDRGKDELAIDLMKYLGSYEVQKRLTIANHTVPANTAALNDPEVQAIYEVARFSASIALGAPIGNHIYTTCQWSAIGEATKAVWDGSLSPEEAMNAAQIGLEECVASINP